MSLSEWRTEFTRSVDDLLAKLLHLAPYGAFRGQPNQRDKLVPLLLRPKQNANRSREKQLIQSFCRRARPFLSNDERLHANAHAPHLALPLARHYGVPTRALDWTLNPFVAAYFACRNKAKADGAIWWFDGKQGGAFERNLSKYWDQHAFTRGPDCQIDLRRLLDSTGLPDRNFVTKLHYGPAIDRMRRQDAFLTTGGSLDVDQGKTIARLADGCCGRLVIPRKLKHDVIDTLARAGIHAEGLADRVLDEVAAAVTKCAVPVGRVGSARVPPRAGGPSS